MHATEVPLGVFFMSLGMSLNKECLVIPDAEKYCTDAKNTLKFFVNGTRNDQFDAYVFNDKDKLLVSYGPKDEDTASQLQSVTDFAVTQHEQKGGEVEAA